MSREKREKNAPTPVPTLWDTIRSAGAADECFADEIAIDFPSVDGMMARVRDSFLGEPPTPRRSRRESRCRRMRHRVVLPLEVPLRGTCQTCGGRGETWTEPCRACCGTGPGWSISRCGCQCPPACRTAPVSGFASTPARRAGARRSSGHGQGNRRLATSPAFLVIGAAKPISLINAEWSSRRCSRR